MKKITMLITMLLAFTTVSYAQFPEGFEGTTFPPAGWASFIGTDGAGTAQNWQRTTDFANTGTASAYVQWENVETGMAEDWLVTPQVAITADNSNLSFFNTEAIPSFEYGSVYTVRVSTTSQTDIASFTTILTMNEDDVPDSFSATNVDLSAYIGQQVYVAFVMTQDDGDGWYIDDVNFGTLVPAPDCVSNPTPADAAVDVATGDVTFSWDAPTTGAAPTGYDMYYGLTPDDVTNYVGSYDTTTALITLNGYDAVFYWMIVPKNAGGSSTGCPVWSFTTESAPAVPDNDACSTATAVTAFPYTNTQNAFSATNNDGFITDCSTSGGMNDGVWYTVVGNGLDLTVSLTDVQGWDPQLDVYSGTCGAFTCVASSDSGFGGDGETVVIPASVLGTTYFINVGNYNDEEDGPEGPFTINIISATTDTPEYANLQWPVNATIGQGESVDVFGQVYEPGLTEAAGQADGIEAWVAVSDENTNPNTWDDALWMPMTFNMQVDNNDEYMLAIGSDLEPATYYYATRWRLNNGPFVYGGIAADASGNFWDGTTYNSGVLTISAAPAPNNDVCEGAFVVTPGGDFAAGAITTTNVGATDDGTGTSCQPVAGEDVWYSVVVPASGNVTIETGPVAGSNYDDSVMVVYSGECGSLTEVECDDDGSENPDGTLFSLISLTGRTPGELLYVSVSRYNNPFASGDWGQFQVSAYDASLANPNFTSSNFKVYPNPVKNVLNLSGVQNISNVAVYNLLGQQVAVKALNASEGQIDMSALSRGTYLVKVTSDNEVKTIKVIKE